jgi:hypothetical protein
MHRLCALILALELSRSPSGSRKTSGSGCLTCPLRLVRSRPGCQIKAVNNMRLEQRNRLRKPRGFVRCFRGGRVGPEPKRLTPMGALAQTKRKTPVGEAGTERQSLPILWITVSTINAMRGRCDPAQGLKGVSLRYRVRRIRSTMQCDDRESREMSAKRIIPRADGTQAGRRSLAIRCLPPAAPTTA